MGGSSGRSPGWRRVDESSVSLRQSERKRGGKRGREESERGESKSNRRRGGV
jgi:hypothetical protein